MQNKHFWYFLSDKCTSGNSFGIEENKLGNLEPKGQARINGVLTKREQLITVKARQRGGDICPGELEVVLCD